MMNENRRSLLRRPPRAGKRRRRPKRKLSWPAPSGAETRELTMSVFEERKARDNNQWRNTQLAGCDDWEGSGEARPPQWRSSLLRRLQKPTCWLPREKTASAV